MSRLNCPNCGAVIDKELNKCPFCGTSYFDFSMIDFTDGKPFYMKIKTNIGDQSVYITQKCIARLGGIEMNTETTDVMSGNGTKVSSIVTSRSVSTNIEFIAIPDNKACFSVCYENQLS